MVSFAARQNMPSPLPTCVKTVEHLHGEDKRHRALLQTAALLKHTGLLRFFEPSLALRLHIGVALPKAQPQANSPTGSEIKSGWTAEAVEQGRP